MSFPPLHPFAYRMLPVLLLAAAVCGCAPGEPLTRPQPSAQAAERLAQRGEPEAAARMWQELAEQIPEQADAYRLEAAAAWLDAGDPDAARRALEDLDAGALDAHGRLRLRVIRGELALLAGDFTSAQRHLAVARDDLPQDLTGRWDRLQRRLAERREAPAEAAVAALRTALEDGSFTPELALSSLIELPLVTLQDLQLEYAGDPTLAPWLDLAITGRSHLLDPHYLEPALADWQRRHPKTGYSADQAHAWLTAFRESMPWPEQVAVLLPAGGPLQRPGQALREGLVARWLELPADDRPDLAFHYVDEHPEAAVGAWFQARENGADFLIGPLDREQVAALLALPDPGLPMLLLNRPPEGREAAGTWPTQAAALALPPEEEAELAAVHALIAGHRRALVLGQSSDWGRRLADRFVETFRLGGGQIAERAEYNPEISDQTERLETVLEIDRSRSRIDALGSLLGGELEAQPRRRSDVDVVFLAARTDDARLIRPQLRFHGAGDLPVYATSHVFMPGRSDPDLEGIQLPAAPWFLADGPHARVRGRAIAQFPGLENPTLSRLHALGRDALSLAPWLGWMHADPALALSGHSGRLRLTDGRVLERDLPWAKITPRGLEAAAPE